MHERVKELSAFELFEHCAQRANLALKLDVRRVRLVQLLCEARVGSSRFADGLEALCITRTLPTRLILVRAEVLFTPHVDQQIRSSSQEVGVEELGRIVLNRATLAFSEAVEVQLTNE